jgi:RNA polymerase sigma-70 factor (ECF subfamily)
VLQVAACFGEPRGTFGLNRLMAPTFRFPRRPTLTVVPGVRHKSALLPASRSDDEILAGLRRGDDGIAADFYWRVKPVVDRTVRRLLGRLDSDGEDIVQVALVQLIESLPSYRGECPLDAWVSAVSANVVYKHIRRRRLERNIFVDTLVDDDVIDECQTSGPTMTAQFRDALRRISGHLAAMNADRAWAFVLHDVCGYSLEEVSHICRISAVAAQSRLVRGRRELHGRVADDATLTGIFDRDDL